MKLKRIPLVVLLWLTCFTFTAVRAERLPIRIYTSADGLGSSFIDYLMRGSRGFMWFCTRDGLSRFDGARFITYRIGDKNSPPGIETLYQTRDGTYWITTTGGLYRFKPDVVSKPDQTTGDRPFLNAEFVGRGRGPLLEDRAGNLWYASNDLYRLKETDGKFVFEAENLNLPSNPNHPISVFQIREAPDGCIWLNTNQGVVRRFPDGRVTLYQRETDVTVGLASMLIEFQGRCWVIWRNNLFVINPAPIESVPRAPQFVIKKGPMPYNGVNIYAAFFPMSKTGDRTFDYRRDGVAHYGMMADFLRDMSLKPKNGEYVRGNIMDNAEYFARMWEKAETNGKNVK